MLLQTFTQSVIPEDGANGVIAVQGGRFAGWALYIKEGVLKYCYYPGPGENVFSCTINGVQIELGNDDVSGLEDPEQVYHGILARR